MDDEHKSIEEKPFLENNSLEKNINVAVIIMLVVLIIFAMFTFFFSMQEAISVLFNPQYAALVKAIFSLIIIGVGVYLVKMFLSK